MTAEIQQDLAAGAKARAKRKAKVSPKELRTKKAVKKAGTAIAVDDPGKRQQVAQQEPTTFLAVVMRAAADPNCDPAKMHSLLDFQERLKNAAAKEAFDDAFVALQAELPSIRRDGKIEIRAKTGTGERDGRLQQSTPYATFNAIHEAIKPLLVKHGFGLSFSTEPTADGRLLVRTTLSRKGHSINTVFPLPAETSGSKNNVQGWGSTQSYGKRYGTIALLNIVSHAVQDADTDGHGGDFVRAKDGLAESTEIETLTDEETAELDRKMVQCKVPLAKVLQHYGIDKLASLPRTMHGHAMKSCDDYAANQKRTSSDFPGDRQQQATRR